MKESISLIGMAGAGKSTLGSRLAKYLGYKFIDSDLLIEASHKKSLQEILNENGIKSFREIEEKNLLSINFNNTVLATGGSAIFSELAMEHIRKESILIYIETTYEDIINRVKDFSQRGFIKKSHQTIEEAFLERQSLYKDYADFVITNDSSIDECFDKIVEIVNQNR